jgi:hypothetical protein
VPAEEAAIHEVADADVEAAVEPATEAAEPKEEE